MTVRDSAGTPSELAPASSSQGKLLTAEEVAIRLGVQPSWVSKAARAKRIPHVRVGRYTRFSWPAIEEWLRDQSVQAR